MEIVSFPWKVVRGFYSSTKILNWVEYVSLAGLVLITFVDVTGRYLMNSPLLGCLEISEVTMGVFGAFAIVYTTTQRGHISVDLFLARFSSRNQRIIDSAGSLLGFAAWGLIAYEVYLLGKRTLEAGDRTGLLGIPLSPFQFVFALGLCLYSLILLIQALDPSISDSRKKEEGPGI